MNKKMLLLSLAAVSAPAFGLEVPTVQVSEPSTLPLLALGVAAAAVIALRNRRKK